MESASKVLKTYRYKFISKSKRVVGISQNFGISWHGMTLKEVAILPRGKILFSSVWVRVGIRVRIRVRVWVRVRIRVRAIFALAAK